MPLEFLGFFQDTEIEVDEVALAETSSGGSLGARKKVGKNFFLISFTYHLLKFGTLAWRFFDCHRRV